MFRQARAWRVCCFLASSLPPGCCSHCRQGAVHQSPKPFVCIAEDRTTTASAPSLPSKGFLFSRTKTNSTGGMIQAGRKRKGQMPYFQKMLFSAQLLGEKGKNDRLSNTRGGESGKENVTSEKECWGLLHHWGMLQSHMKNTVSFLSVSWVLDFCYACWQPACKLQKFVLGTAFDRDLYWRNGNRRSKASTGHTSASRKTQHRY